MTLKSTYSAEMRSQLGLFPVWPPGDPIKAGDIGTLQGGVFEKQTSLKERFGTLKVRLVRQALDRPYRFCSKDCVLGEIRAAGKAAGTGSAAMQVKFGANGGVIFEAAGLTRQAIDNLYEVRSFIREHRTAWPAGHVLIGSVDRATRFRVLISENRNGSATLSGKLDALKDLKVADASVKVSTDASAGYQVNDGSGAVSASVYGFGWIPAALKGFKLLQAEPEAAPAGAGSDEDFVALAADRFPADRYA